MGEEGFRNLVWCVSLCIPCFYKFAQRLEDVRYMITISCMPKTDPLSLSSNLDVR